MKVKRKRGNEVRYDLAKQTGACVVLIIRPFQVFYLNLVPMEIGG